MLSGDFSNVKDQNGNTILLHGYLGQPNPFQTVNGKPNQIDPNLFSKGAVALDKFIPLGQDPVSALVRFAQPQQVTDFNEGTGRLDYNNQQRMFVRLFIDELQQPGQNIPGNILSGVQGQHGVDLNAAMNHSWTISPTLVNSITAGYISYDLDQGTPVLDASGKPICLSQFIAVNDPPNACYINLGVQNGNSLYGGASGFNVFSGTVYQTNRRMWMLSDTATKIFGKHTLAAGFDAMHRHYFEDYGGPVNPGLGFKGSYTGYMLADFLLGYSTGVGQGTGEVGATSGWMFGAYLQDQYKLRPNITLNVGLRWDPNLTPSITGNRGAAFIPGKQNTRFPNAPVGMIFSGEQGIPSGLVQNSYSYVQPRLGVAWQVNEKTAIRTGLGFFTTPLEDAFYNRVFDANPFDPSDNIPYNSAVPDPFDNPWILYAPTGGKSPFPPFITPNSVAPANSAFPEQQGLSAVFDPNFKLGITQSWNLSIERQIGQDIALHIAYVGSESYHQATTVEQNPGKYYGPGDARNGNRPTYTSFQNILQVQDGATASYHSLQAGIEKRMSNGNNNSFFDVGQDRADVVKGQPYSIRSGAKSHWVNHYFNVNAFTNNAFGTPGSIEKFTFQEVPIQDVDMAVMKNISYRERFKLQLRVESFNALNHPSFGQPDSNPGDGNFGQITGLGPVGPRVMQGGVKMTF